MRSKEEITEIIKAQIANVRERGKVLAQALRMRADIAATRRRLRATFADLGEAAYARLLEGELGGEAAFEDFKLRIEGLKAELRQREEALRELLEGGGEEGEEEGEAGGSSD